MAVQFYPTLDSDSIRSHLPTGSYLLPAASWARQRKPGQPLPVPRLPNHIGEIAADCGGYVASMRAHHLGLSDGYTFSPDEYVEWLALLGPRLTWAATFDRCIQPAKGSPEFVRQAQEYTTERAWYFWQRFRAVPWTWTVTIQGWSVAEYAWHAEQLRPLIEEMATDYGPQRGWRVGIGSLCRRASVPLMLAVCQAVSTILHDIPLHLWGVSWLVFHAPVELPGQLVSVDSSAWNRLSEPARAECRASGLSQREWASTVALPRYLAKVAQAEGQPKQRSLFDAA